MSRPKGAKNKPKAFYQNLENEMTGSPKIIRHIQMMDDYVRKTHKYSDLECVGNYFPLIFLKIR